jgi:outer membrane protein assembly complex protein YaeT
MEAKVPMKSRYLILAFALSGIALAKTEIDIRGMKSKSEREVLQLMGDRLVYVRSKPASSWRAADAAFLVTEILRNDGFNDVRVTPKIEAPDRIALIVEEGSRLSLGDVKITGEGDAKQLAKLYSLPAKKDTPIGAGSAPFREEDVEIGLGFIKQQLESEGYWNARATLIDRVTDTESGKVHVTIAVNRGKRFTIQKASVRSPDERGVKRAATTWEPFLGAWATTEQINGLRAAMEEAFISRGYPDAKIRMEATLGAGTYQPAFFIDLGIRVRLREVHAEGLVRTRAERVKRIMQPLEGEWYDQAAMNGKVKRLLATGAFDSVRTDTYEVSSKRIDVTLHFQEARAKEVTLAGGFGTFNGPLLRAGYIDRNFRGSLKGFSAGVELSGRGALGEVKLTDPWWRGTETAHTLRLYSLVRAYEGYTSYETGLESGWKWQPSPRRRMELLLGYSFLTATEDGLPAALLGETDYNHVRVAFTHTWDHRDSAILPQSGWHFGIPVQLGAAIGDTTETYAKVGVDGGVYYPLNDTYQLGIGGFANWVFPSGDIRRLPVDLRVFNGGARSVRSFPERELGPSFGGDPYGGDFSWVVNTELSRPLTGALTAVAFVDAGAVKGNYTGIRQGGLELAAGLGLRLDLPIGPVRLEYGHNLSQDTGEPTGTWHFAIGATF